MSLERWQKYSKAKPCPVCGGFNSGRKALGTLCKGFLHADKKHAFCQRKEAETITSIYGLILYKHTLKLQEEEGPRTTRPVPSSDIIETNGNTRIVKKKVTYEGRKLFGKEIPPESRTWFVVERCGGESEPFVEVTRDLSLETARLFLR